MGCLRLPVLYVTIALICHVQAAQIHVAGSWTGGLSGTVTLHSSHPIHGWTVHLTFNRVYNRLTTGFGTATRVNAHEWILKNVDWDSTIQPWKPITISFVADMGHGDKIPSGHSAGTYNLEVHHHTAKTTQMPHSTKHVTTTPTATTTTTTALPSSTDLHTTTPTASTTTTTALPSSTKHHTTTPLTSSVKTTALPSSTKLVSTPLTSSVKTTGQSSSMKLSTTTPFITTRLMFTATSAPAIVNK